MAFGSFMKRAIYGFLVLTASVEVALPLIGIALMYGMVYAGVKGDAMYVPIRFMNFNSLAFLGPLAIVVQIAVLALAARRLWLSFTARRFVLPASMHGIVYVVTALVV